jgi:hypothetical protein
MILKRWTQEESRLRGEEDMVIQAKCTVKVKKGVTN